MNKTTSHQNTVYPQTVEIPEPLEVHPSISPLAAELLMKTAEKLITEPACYNQGNFTGHRCNTPCCILGHMAEIAGHKLDYDERGKQNAAPLGLTMDQYVSIFFIGQWPFPVRPVTGLMSATTVKEAIARINHFLSTGQ